jgi:uncharacterized protein YbjT (DUF2867 family)
MRVLVTGAYGLIGSACLARLNRDSHALVAAGRAVQTASRRFPYAEWISADFTRLTTVDAWREMLAGIDAVVNCVGVLQDGARDDVRRVQLEATAALFDGCAGLGVRRVVHVSAIGAGEAGPTAFARTKAAAEAHLRALDLDWVIVRPALVLAPAVYGGTAILRGLAGIPLLTPLIGTDSRIQIVSIDDVAETVARAIAPAAPAKVTWDVAHPQIHALRDIVAAIRGWLGFPPRPAISLPRVLGWPVTLVADLLGWLGWRSPARTTAVAQLAAGVVGDPTPWMRATGIQPQNLDAILAARPSTVQDRWHAHLYWLKPLAIAALAFVWIAHGLVRLDEAIGADRIPPASAADVYVVAIAVLSLVVGIGVVARPTARMALVGMALLPILHVVVSLLYRGPSWPYAFEPVADAMAYALPPLFVLAVLDER